MQSAHQFLVFIAFASSYSKHVFLQFHHVHCFHERHRVLLVLCVGFFLACAPLCDFEIVWRRLCPMCTISQSFICYWWQLRCVTSMEYAACTSRQFSVWCSFIMSTKYCKTGCLLNSFSSVLELHYTAVVHQI